jgi:putative Holliday junction resolvase
MARILAFDFGLKRVGVAVSDPLQIIANSLETVPTLVIYDFIAKYLKAEEVECFVVGYPYNNYSGENEVAKYVNQFIDKLSSMYPDKPNHKIDERFTSTMAKHTLLLSGVSKKERQKKENTDAIAANLILQTFMASKH